ncbi:MAG: NGG1p interacting factor NIF3 [Deltaproteobacteria bacterium]|nr:NGG1p interacting factor NIF3 [Deltaproteobacteria bacterium]
MKIREIYERAYKRGIELDPRGKAEVEEQLKAAKKEYDGLSEKKKARFDKESLVNPYADTRILHGSPDKEVKRVLVGIDIEVGEIVLADRLREKGEAIDLVITHHPEGRAMAALYDVMGMQSAILFKQGLPIHVAEDVMDERIKEVERRLLPANHMRAVDAARLLDVPLMSIHTPSDNAVQTYLQDMFDLKAPRLVSDVIEAIDGMDEYKLALSETVGPRVVVGSDSRRAGKIFVDMTGGTGGSKMVYEGLSTAGVGTIVGMHIGEDHRKEAQKHHVNVVIAGHISSDNLGLNLLFDDILEGVDVIACSGFRRVSRRK